MSSNRNPSKKSNKGEKIDNFDSTKLVPIEESPNNSNRVNSNREETAEKPNTKSTKAVTKTVKEVTMGADEIANPAEGLEPKK